MGSYSSKEGLAVALVFFVVIVVCLFHCCWLVIWVKLTSTCWLSALEIFACVSFPDILINSSFYSRLLLVESATWTPQSQIWSQMCLHKLSLCNMLSSPQMFPFSLSYWHPHGQLSLLPGVLQSGQPLSRWPELMSKWDLSLCTQTHLPFWEVSLLQKAGKCLSPSLKGWNLLLPMKWSVVDPSWNLFISFLFAMSSCSPPAFPSTQSLSLARCLLACLLGTATPGNCLHPSLWVSDLRFWCPKSWSHSVLDSFLSLLLLEDFTACSLLSTVVAAGVLWVMGLLEEQ